MSSRRRLGGVKWSVALSVAVVLHVVVFRGVLPQAFPPPLVQPASTRVLLISLPFTEPDTIVEEHASDLPSERVQSPPPLIAEASPVETEVDDSERDPASELASDPSPEPERERLKLEDEPEIALKREQEQEAARPIADEPAVEEQSVPFDDSVLAVEDRADVDGLFDVPPRALQTIEPKYPIDARRRKREGDVLCEAVITKRGRVETAHVVLSSGYQELDEAALVALRRARFEPAVRRNRSVEAIVRITITFRLTER